MARNNATGEASTVAGGSGNQATAPYTAIGAGQSNTAGGLCATVPGGDANHADGNYSFAAGRRAKANNDGAFVWADSTDADFASTDADQFLIRASGGVGIGTAAPTCPHCGYDIRGLPTDPVDGVTICPECGCAWMLQGEAERVELGRVPQSRPTPDQSGAEGRPS